MQQPDHDIRIARATQATPRRLISLGIVGLLHLVFIYALVTGLAQSLVKKGIDEIKVATVQDKPVDKPPPPPPPPLEQPPPPFVPPPDIVIENAAPVTTITTQDRQPVITPPPPAPKAAPVTTPISIGRPHSCQQVYPEMSQRLNEEGTTTLAFTVDTEGNVSNVSVANSSGHDRLDQAAISCAQHWKYKAATSDGQAVALPWKANVQWKLH
ncbi:MAG TPA: energy transducer TonB [Rhizomicrobium sp.]|jgi:protein TonB